MQGGFGSHIVRRGPGGADVVIDNAVDWVNLDQDPPSSGWPRFTTRQIQGISRPITLEVTSNEHLYYRVDASSSSFGANDPGPLSNEPSPGWSWAKPVNGSSTTRFIVANNQWVTFGTPENLGNALTIYDFYITNFSNGNAAVDSFSIRTYVNVDPLSSSSSTSATSSASPSSSSTGSSTQSSSSAGSSTQSSSSAGSSTQSSSATSSSSRSSSSAGSSTQSSSATSSSTQSSSAGSSAGSSGGSGGLGSSNQASGPPPP